MILICNSTSNFRVFGEIDFDSVQHLCQQSKSRWVRSKTRANVLIRKKFNSVIMKIEKPKVTAQIFKSGKIVLLGAKSIDEVNEGAKIIAGKLGREIIENPVTTNWVGTYAFGYPLNLDNYCLFMRQYHGNGSVCTYEAELFDALMYQPDSSKKAKCTIFKSGKLILTGCKTIGDLNETFNSLKTVMAAGFYLSDLSSFIH